MQKVLIIDDNPAIGSALSVLLNLHEIECESVLTPQAGIQRLTQDADIALIVQDMNFTEDTTSGEEGKALFYAIREIHPDIPVILLTAWTQLDTAVELVKNGAADYVGKPWDDQKLLTTITNLLELAELQQQQLQQTQMQQTAKEKLALEADLCGLIYQSSVMHNLIDMAVKIAPSDVPVLITGANGSGKEKIAEIIQANSRVNTGAFIRVNVGALPDELMEAELFGAEAGAYTGITKKRIGRFEAADNGTLFLDEIGNLSASGQAKLLRVLQTGEFERLGSSTTYKCNVRVISATNTDLPNAIKEGEFREDLFYRLNVIELKLPPLADRKEDILPLARRFLGRKTKLESNTVKALQSYSWPGNVRELENTCQRARLLGKEQLEQNTPLSLTYFGLDIDKIAISTSSFSVEPSKEMIQTALTENQDIIAQAARQLGLTRQALYRRMKKHGI